MSDWAGDERRQSTALERHVQSLLLIMVAGLLAWIGVSTTQTREGQARIEERLHFLAKQVEEMRGDHYTRGDATRDFGQVKDRIEIIDSRVRRLEDRK